jgi:hypothetical protein
MIACLRYDRLDIRHLRKLPQRAHVRGICGIVVHVHEHVRTAVRRGDCREVLKE